MFMDKEKSSCMHVCTLLTTFFLDEGDVDPSEADVQTNLSLDLLWCVLLSVGLVLCLGTYCTSIPAAVVADNQHSNYPQSSVDAQ